MFENQHRPKKIESAHYNRIKVQLKPPTLRTLSNMAFTLDALTARRNFKAMLS